MKELFGILTSQLSIVDDVLTNYILIAIVGFIAYKLAFFLEGETGARGELGSIIHWTIRLFIFVALVYIIKAIIFVYLLLTSISIFYYLSLALIILLIFLKKYAIENKESILNQKVI
ncbi:MAG: hypothetical protein PHD02_04575 [Bacilli bacterium]|nr:hypothetical protein [Bacilli bacterium]